MTRQTRASTRVPTDAETDATITNFLSWATTPPKGSGSRSLDSRYDGLRCLQAMPLYKDLAAAVEERNACEKLYSKTEEKLKALDAKVQTKLNAIGKFNTKIKRVDGYK